MTVACSIRDHPSFLFPGPVGAEIRDCSHGKGSAAGVGSDSKVSACSSAGGQHAIIKCCLRFAEIPAARSYE